jgi:hypothetical protein
VVGIEGVTEPVDVVSGCQGRLPPF